MSDSTRRGEDTSPHIPPCSATAKPREAGRAPVGLPAPGTPRGAEAALGAQASRSQPCSGADISSDPLLWGFLSLITGPAALCQGLLRKVLCWAAQRPSGLPAPAQCRAPSSATARPHLPPAIAARPPTARHGAGSTPEDKGRSITPSCWQR